jgi:hypothetical protein
MAKPAAASSFIRETSDVWLLLRLVQSRRDIDVTILETRATIKESLELLDRINDGVKLSFRRILQCNDPLGLKRTDSRDRNYGEAPSHQRARTAP